MSKSETRICSRCVLPQTDDITLDEGGLCSVCLSEEEELKNNEEAPLLETDLIKILNKYRGKSKYDCLVMCSGGKDSTSSLYYMKKRYKMNPLAFTFDHGFETEDAMKNIRNAVEILGVDFLFFKTDYMKEMFADMVRGGTEAVICHPCSIWYMQLTFDIAARYNIPIIIAGWTKGQSTRQPVMSKCGCNVHQKEFRKMGLATEKFLKEYLPSNPKYKDFPLSMEEALARARKKHKARVLSPHWFIRDDAEEYVKLIQKELKWEYPLQSYPKKSTNCYLNFLSVDNSIKYFGYTHYHVEMSKLIRAGQLSRREALDALNLDYSEEIIRDIHRMLGVESENSR